MVEVLPDSVSLLQLLLSVANSCRLPISGTQYQRPPMCQRWPSQRLRNSGMIFSAPVPASELKPNVRCSVIKGDALLQR